ncbi:dTDP-4-dehydrorhamnose reductase [Curvibacter sp. AEP1-3]|uniref:dTDP-4-dehydrorhamnose reductase family protein n=1 Tax=Curvibacter sp. AEP1-3 TaxID=1844971 RepID=UPI000B3C4748|nr:SDR family oxidoreductase [Curvibacter sp. AEP1-3]ARV18654.1 dTDP-4-dehydrorhamnose reductase [Curvibacter sp. AEP1-3]
MNILVLGVSGMLGSAMYRVLSADSSLKVYGTARSEGVRQRFTVDLSSRIFTDVNAEDLGSLIDTFANARPDVVINCVGLVKQLKDASNPLLAVPINTLLPHHLAALCKAIGARLVQISTDCVFSGSKGNYTETDFADADDLYGRTKLLGEVHQPHAITLRTSIIGHELSGHRSLVGWFLAQQKAVKGFTKATFSGLPTVELAHVVRDFVLKAPSLHGVYHVAGQPINKYELLKLIGDVYQKDVEIIADESLVIDRSLNAQRFNQSTGYQAPDWLSLVQRMHAFQ